MALHKLFPKFLFFGFTGLSAVTGLKYISPLISSNIKENKNPGILVDTKNSTSTFNELIDSKIVLELLKTHKNNLLISAGGTLIGCGLFIK